MVDSFWFTQFIAIRSKNETQLFLKEYGEAGYGILCMVLETLSCNISKHGNYSCIYSKKHWGVLLGAIHHHKLHKYFTSLSTFGVMDIEILSLDELEYSTQGYCQSSAPYPTSSHTDSHSNHTYPDSSPSYPHSNSTYPPSKTCYPSSNANAATAAYHCRKIVGKDELIKISLPVIRIGTEPAFAHTRAPALKNYNIYNTLEEREERREKTEERREENINLNLYYKAHEGGEYETESGDVSSTNEASLRDASASLSFLKISSHSHSKSDGENTGESIASSRANEIGASVRAEDASSGSQNDISQKWLCELKTKFSPDIVDFVADFQRERADSLGVRASKISLALLTECCKTVSDVIRIDGFELREIKFACEWGAKDSFWASNLVSLARLRTTSKSGLKKIHTLCSQYSAYKKKSDKYGPYGDSRFIGCSTCV